MSLPSIRVIPTGLFVFPKSNGVVFTAPIVLYFLEKFFNVWRVPACSDWAGIAAILRPGVSRSKQRQVQVTRNEGRRCEVLETPSSTSSQIICDGRSSSGERISGSVYNSALDNGPVVWQPEIIQIKEKTDKINKKDFLVFCKALCRSYNPDCFELCISNIFKKMRNCCREGNAVSFFQNIFFVFVS